MRPKTVSVIGAGAWGTALAEVAARAGHTVTLHARRAEQADAINATRENRAYLPGDRLSETITAQAGFARIGAPDIVLLAVPAQQSRAVLDGIGASALDGRPVVLCAKGLETGTLLTQSQILTEEAPGAVPFVLSGPSFAHDVVSGRPTAVTLAGRDATAAQDLARALSGKTFRLYVSTDIGGVEQAGALKNVYALAAGAVEGADLGLSARSALIARAHAEMRRLVTAMGGDRETLSGLAGLGDLTLSCTTPQSRNYSFGLALGQGKSIAEIEAAGARLAEGVKTAPVARDLARTLGVETPLIDAVTLLLAQKAQIGDIVAMLMTRPLKREN